MLVKDWMTKTVVTLEVTDSLQHAINLVMENHVSMFPVLEEGKLVGIVTDRDLKRASPSDMARLDIQQIIYHVSRVEVGAIMSRYPITVPLNWTIEEAAEILMTNKISGCPVLDENGEIRGLITKSDLFRALIALSGLSHRGFQFGFLMEDNPGSIKVVTDIIRKYGARLCSILSSYEKAPQGFRNVYIRAFDVEREKVADLEAELKSNAKMLYMVDHRENTRKIYE
jgi:acetoin utilization protein AcuB